MYRNSIFGAGLAVIALGATTQAQAVTYINDSNLAHFTLAEYGTFTQAIKDSGNHVAGDALQPISTATSIRVRNGETLVTDGPFAETKEQLGGYYLIEAKDVDEALKVAERIPSARYGTIEVRPVVVWEE